MSSDFRLPSHDETLMASFDDTSLGISARWRSKVNTWDISSNNDRSMQTGDGDDEEMRPSSIIFLIVYISSDDYKI